ncbi:MAG: hypothetical protein ACREXU_19040, partial [Gammaproteobacteria bacterium]
VGHQGLGFFQHRPIQVFHRPGHNEIYQKRYRLSTAFLDPETVSNTCPVAPTGRGTVLRTRPKARSETKAMSTEPRIDTNTRVTDKTIADL